MAGGGPPADRQDRVAIGQQVGMGERVAVDRAVRVWRQVHRRDDVAGEDAADRRRQRRRLGPDHGGDPLIDPRQCRCDGQQIVAKGKAVVGELGHHARP